MHTLQEPVIDHNRAQATFKAAAFMIAAANRRGDDSKGNGEGDAGDSDDAADLVSVAQTDGSFLEDSVHKQPLLQSRFAASRVASVTSDHPDVEAGAALAELCLNSFAPGDVDSGVALPEPSRPSMVRRSSRSSVTQLGPGSGPSHRRTSSARQSTDAAQEDAAAARPDVEAGLQAIPGRVDSPPRPRRTPRRSISDVSEMRAGRMRRRKVRREGSVITNQVEQFDVVLQQLACGDQSEDKVFQALDRAADESRRGVTKMNHMRSQRDLETGGGQKVVPLWQQKRHHTLNGVVTLLQGARWNPTLTGSLPGAGQTGSGLPSPGGPSALGLQLAARGRRGSQPTSSSSRGEVALARLDQPVIPGGSICAPSFSLAGENGQQQHGQPPNQAARYQPRASAPANLDWPVIPSGSICSPSFSQQPGDNGSAVLFKPAIPRQSLCAEKSRFTDTGDNDNTEV